MNALKLQGFDGRLGRRWRIEIDETVAFALVGILIEDGFGRNDGAESKTINYKFKKITNILSTFCCCPVAIDLLATQFLQVLVGGVGCQSTDVEVGPGQLIAVVGTASAGRRRRIGSRRRRAGIGTASPASAATYTDSASARRAAVALTPGPRAAATVAAVIRSSHAGLRTHEKINKLVLHSTFINENPPDRLGGGEGKPNNNPEKVKCVIDKTELELLAHPRLKVSNLCTDRWILARLLTSNHLLLYILPL